MANATKSTIPKDKDLIEKQPLEKLKLQASALKKISKSISKNATVLLFLLSATVGFSQNVGIGNTAPDEKLHVTGKVKIEHALIVKPVSKTAAATIAINSNDGFVVIAHASGMQANAISMTGTPTDGQILTIRNDDADDDATFGGATISASTTMQFAYTNSTWKQVGSPSGAATITAIADADADTKIQVEESADEDIIRFDLKGTERWRMTGKRLEPVNNGTSTFIGKESGFKYHNNSSNTGIGYYALGYNNGNDNTAVGARALISNTLGDYNTANGSGALYFNLSGSENSAFGSNALFLSKGHKNSAFGRSAMYSNTDGHNNSSFGFKALYYNTTGAYNASMGAEASIKNTTGSFNVANGFRSLYSNKTGNYNISVGYYALFSNVSGNNNVAIGNQAGYSETGSNKLYIANSNTTSPLIYGEFDNDLLRINGTLNINDEFSFPDTDGASGEVLVTDGAGTLSWTALSSLADNQTVDVFSLSGSTLSLSLEDDGASTYTLDLSSINTDTDTDNQTVDVFSLSGSTLSLSLEDDGASTNTLDLSSINTDNQTVDVFSLSGSTLSLSLEDDGASTNTLNLSSINTDNQTVDVFSLSGSTLSISLEDDGASTNTLDLSSINTDNQTVDVFSLSGSTLNISLEDDGASTYTVDLSTINSTKALIADADNDTKIQVEESVDEDIIRFDLGGTEKWVMEGSRLEPLNTGNSTFIGFESGLNDDLSTNSNTAIGNKSMYTNTSGYNSVAMGSLAMYKNTTGFQNVAIGNAALYGNTTGSSNVAIGNAALISTTGSGNVAIGTSAGFYETGSNKLYIANSNTTSPLIYGEFDNDLLIINGFLRPALDDKYTLGNSSRRWKALYATNGTIQTSDERFKKNITTMNYGLDELMALRSVTYQWKEDSLGETKLGFIAQELELVVPEVVTVGTDSMQTRGVNYAELIPVLVKAIQEQQEIITNQKLKIENSENANALQDKRLADLEAKLSLLLNANLAIKD